MLSITGWIPPTWARSGVPNWPRMPMSMLRADRIGPTTLVPWHWKTAAKRVIPPSTGSSKTMSALLSPVWGRAPDVVCDLDGQRRALGHRAPAGDR